MSKQKHFNFLCVVFLASILHVTAQHTTDSTGSKTAKVFAVIIGISHYQNKILSTLKFADNDATQFATYLQSNAGGNTPSNQIKLLVNEGATIAAVYDALDWLKEQCGKDDIAYIYFSGHGDVETKNTFSQGYLLAYNTPPNNYPNNAIRIEDINNEANILSLNNKAKVILITDACHSGTLAGDFYKGKQLAASQLRLVLNNEVRLASCKVDELALEGINWGGGRGVFSYYLLLGLKGFANSENDGAIKLKSLNKYLDSSFAADKNLALNKDKQHPVTDGNPLFTMARVDSATFASLKIALANKDSATLNLPAGLSGLKPLGIQPIDYFFAVFETRDIETFLNFDSYSGMPAEDMPLKIVTDCILRQQQLFKKRDSLQIEQGTDIDFEYFSIDSLNMLKNQLLKNKSVVSRFNEKLIQSVHAKGQEMINAYLAGDIAELEKRQYYYAGKRQYSDYLSMLHLAIKVAPANHQLIRLLKLHDSYLSGLIDRLKMATSATTQSLLAAAFQHQQQALKLEPYAAYIHNELGNLYLNKKNYDSASYHFGVAIALAPTWAVPWSNKIRMNLALNKLEEAEQAIHKADSLQPNLAYVMINAGMVKEKKKNWLAAETLYLQAISKNNVHFLPYERLGNIYLNTGEYDRADTFLLEAKIRKDDFAVNDQQFKLGLELGGLMYSSDPVQKDSCTIISAAGSEQWQPFIKLANGLDILADTSAKSEEGIRLTQEALQQIPNIPLAHHYIGKQLYLQGKWQQAAAVLEQAVLNHRAEAALRDQLKKMIYGRSAAPQDTCLLNLLMYYQYDELEDHYLLGQIYENQALFDKAIQQYNSIATIENERQLEQANYKGFSFNFKYDSEKAIQQSNKLMEIYEHPIWMGGAIKAARLFEKEGEYEKAENVLLRQVALNRAAGNARQAAIDAKIPGTWKLITGLKINFYWLTINSYLESETYNFYRKMMDLFPREGEWKEKAGMFLHNRLALAFNQMPTAEYKPFYQSIERYSYPWMGGEEPPEPFDMKIVLPATNEEIIIKKEVYDPVTESLGNLQQSIKLSGDVHARMEILAAVADLNSWMGNSEAAIKFYNEAIETQPRNVLLRNKVLSYLVDCNELTAACKQLDDLNQQNQLIHQQKIQLANWQILSGRMSEATVLLKNYKPINTEEKNKLWLLYARMNWLSDRPQIALTYLQGSSAPVQLNKKNDEQITAYNNAQISFRLYSIARMYAQMNQDKKAFDMLQQALDAGFNYKYVLDNDTAWKKIKSTTRWNTIMKNRSFNLDNGLDSTSILSNPISFRIPYIKPDTKKEK
jgi:Flp pilus assembly protein TadD